MPGSLSVAVMTHPSRLTSATALAERLAEPAVRVVVDPFPNHPPATLRTSVEAWAAHSPDATHHLVVQDDALPVDGFLDLARAAADTHDSCAVAHYAEWASRNGSAVRMAAAVGARSVEAVPDYVPCQALSLPRAAAEEYVAFGRAWPDPQEPDDVVLLRYTEDIGLPVRITVPNLVAHDQLPSLVGNHIKGERNSACFTGEEHGGPGRLPLLSGLTVLPFLKHGRAQVYACTEAEGNIWETMEIDDAVPWTGLPSRAVDAAHLADAPRHTGPWFERLKTSIAPEQRKALWTSAFMIGHFRERHEIFREFRRVHGRRIDQPLLDEALRTLPIGGLFPVVSHRLSSSLAQELRQLAVCGLEAGERWSG